MGYDSTQPGLSFDLTPEARSAEQNFQGIRWRFVASISAVLVMGPVIGYLKRANLGGATVGTSVGAVLGLGFAILGFVLYRSLAGRRPTTLLIQHGILTFRYDDGRTKWVDLTRLRKAPRLVTFSANFPLPTPYPAELGPRLHWTPWLDLGFGGLALSPAAAGAVRDEFLRQGWSANSVESQLGNIHIQTFRFSR